MAELKRLRSPMRVGLLRGPSMTYKPFVRVGLASDGGVFVVPAQVESHPWVYGNFTEQESQQNTWVLTSERPKLHYHRSGFVAASLTGKQLVRRSAQFTPLARLVRAHLFIITVVRPWQLPTRGGGLKKRDVSSIERTWPQICSLELSVLDTSDDADLARFDEIAPVNAVADDPASFFVDLRAYGHRALLFGTFSSSYKEWTRSPEPGISVVALSQGTLGNRDCFGLWSRSLGVPVLGGPPEVRLPQSGRLVDPLKGDGGRRTIEDVWATHANERPGWSRTLAWERSSNFFDPDSAN